MFYLFWSIVDNKLLLSTYKMGFGSVWTVHTTRTDEVDGVGLGISTWAVVTSPTKICGFCLTWKNRS